MLLMGMVSILFLQGLSAAFGSNPHVGVGGWTENAVSKMQKS
jgi:hypothetical protein